MVSPRIFALIVLAVALGTSAVSCTTYKDNLSRGERLYQENKFGDALALWRLMERDVDALSRADQARYAYLRGMTDYRLGFRSDARHWLAIAKAIHDQEVASLDANAEGTTKTTLGELNRDVYGLVPVETESSTKEHADEQDEPREEEPAPASESVSEESSESPPRESPPSRRDSSEPFCRVDADCPGSEICVAERCTAP